MYTLRGHRLFTISNFHYASTISNFHYNSAISNFYLLFVFCCCFFLHIYHECFSSDITGTILWLIDEWEKYNSLPTLKAGTLYPPAGEWLQYETISRCSLTTVWLNWTNGLLMLINSMVTELIRPVNYNPGRSQKLIKLEISSCRCSQLKCNEESDENWRLFCLIYPTTSFKWEKHINIIVDYLALMVTAYETY